MISEYDEIGDLVWDRFHGGVEAQSWYYQSILDSLHTQIQLNKNTETQKQFQSIFIQLQQAISYLFDEKE